MTLKSVLLVNYHYVKPANYVLGKMINRLVCKSEIVTNVHHNSPKPNVVS